MVPLSLGLLMGLMGLKQLGWVVSCLLLLSLMKLQASLLQHHLPVPHRVGVRQQARLPILQGQLVGCPAPAEAWVAWWVHQKEVPAWVPAALLLCLHCWQQTVRPAGKVPQGHHVCC